MMGAAGRRGIGLVVLVAAAIAMSACHGKTGTSKSPHAVDLAGGPHAHAAGAGGVAASDAAAINTSGAMCDLRQLQVDMEWCLNRDTGASSRSRIYHGRFCHSGAEVNAGYADCQAAAGGGLVAHPGCTAGQYLLAARHIIPADSPSRPASCTDGSAPAATAPIAPAPAATTSAAASPPSGTPPSAASSPAISPIPAAAPQSWSCVIPAASGTSALTCACSASQGNCSAQQDGAACQCELKRKGQVRRQ